MSYDTFLLYIIVLPEYVESTQILPKDSVIGRQRSHVGMLHGKERLEFLTDLGFVFGGNGVQHLPFEMHDAELVQRRGKSRAHRIFDTAQRIGDNQIDLLVMSEKVCKILLRPSPPAWGTPSRRGICDVDFYLSFYLIFHSRKYGSRLAYVPSVFSLATEPKR